ncbi:MAG: hypothetical protein AB7H80_04475 [Candidatus Kapaibacterium sp.]
MLNLFEEFFGIVRSFEDHGIRYAVIGGFAMAFHDLLRATDDLDYLVLTDDIEKAIELVKEAGFRESGQPIYFQNSRMTLYRLVKFTQHEHILVDLLTSIEQDHIDVISEAVTMDVGFGKIHVANKEAMIKLKQVRSSTIDLYDIRRLRGETDDESGTDSEEIK